MTPQQLSTTLTLALHCTPCHTIEHVLVVTKAVGYDRQVNLPQELQINM